MNSDERRRGAAILAAILVFGGLLSAWLARGFFVHPPGEIHETHERYSYVYRLVEFREALAAGYLSPQWCSHFRGGLGSPFFSYYQPAFFYLATLFSWWMDPVKALGVAVWCFSFIGFVSTYWLIASRFDAASGLLAASLLLLSSYAGTELYVRGDLTEFAAMMIVPLLLVCLVGWLERATAWRLAATCLAFAWLTTLHPCVALPAISLAIAIAAGYSIAARRWRRGLLSAAALVLGGMIAAFYWMPIVREWELVQAQNAFSGYYHYARHFINPLLLILPEAADARRNLRIPFSLGLLMPLLALANVIGLGVRWKLLTPSQRRLAITMVCCLLVSVFLMTRFSAVVWSIATPLQKLQFPWRLMTLVTVSLAALCGPVALMFQPRSRWLLVGGLIALGWWWSVPYTQRVQAEKFHATESASNIAQELFSADLMHEWLPRGANPIAPQTMPAMPSATPGVEVADYQLASGRLHCTVTATAAGSVTLPHYLFPGWRVTFDGKPCEVRADNDGLMIVDVPQGASGELVAQFTSTPAKRLGWIVSAASLVALVGLSVGLHFWQRGDSPPEPRAKG